MDNYTATEVAYKNGYDQGYKVGLKEARTKQTKNIPLKTIKQYYKRFAHGEQYINIDSFGKIASEDKNYYWQQRRVYNHILPIILSQGKDLSEDNLYGRNGLVALLEPYQREYNKIMNLHNEHLESATHGWIAVEDGSVDVDDLTEEGLAPGKVVIYRQGSKAPIQVKDDLNTEHYLKSADYYLNLMIAVANTFCNSLDKGISKN